MLAGRGADWRIAGWRLAGRGADGRLAGWRLAASSCLASPGLTANTWTSSVKAQNGTKWKCLTYFSSEQASSAGSMLWSDRTVMAGSADNRGRTQAQDCSARGVTG